MSEQRKTNILDDICPYCNTKFKVHKNLRCKDIAFIYYKLLEALDSNFRPQVKGD